MSDSNFTKNALAQSMKNLMRRRPFEKISVSDICVECGINRKSFYYHFRDKYDLVRKMADGFFADIAALVEARKRYDVVPDSPFGAMDALYGSLLAKRRLALALWDVKCEGLDFSGELASIVEGAYLSHFGKAGAGDPVLQAKLASAMVVAMLHYRLEAGEPFTAADIHAELDVLHRRVSGSR